MRYVAELPSGLAFCCRLMLTLITVLPMAGALSPSPVCADEKSSPAKMTLEIEINRPQNAVRGYRRPYVAAWLADKDGFPVRTISLWVQQAPPGERWVPDLRQWYRDDRVRQLVDDLNLVDAVSSATRNAGKHKVAWDGNDDNGKPLPAGTYTLIVESAREHGTYQIIREKLELGAKAFQRDLKGNAEISAVRVNYVGQKSSR